MKTAVIGGGAAGFFAAICLKEQLPQMGVTILEQKRRVLAKVEVSGGGRCNCTNTFDSVADVSAVYPRGHRLMKRLLKGFSQHDAYAWFERHGVALTVQDDNCVFPASQDSHTIIDCFLSLALTLGVEIRTETPVASPDELLADYDYVVVTTGGMPKGEGTLAAWLMAHGHDIVPPVPSLFTFRLPSSAVLPQLMGIVADNAAVAIPATSFRADGPLLITHWGVSGPAILKLSSYAARYLADNNYQAQLAVNWTGCNEEAVRTELQRLADAFPLKQLASVAPFGLSARLWAYLLDRCLGERATARWGGLSRKEQNCKQAGLSRKEQNDDQAGIDRKEKNGNQTGLSRKEQNRLVNILSGGDHYQIAGRAPFKDEFVTCGGVSLASVKPTTLESRTVPRLFFAGEVLDIDGVTGGFNFQAAWTTAYTVALAISRHSESGQ